VHVNWHRLVAIAVAVSMSGWLIGAGPPTAAPTAAPKKTVATAGLPTLSAAYPGASVVTTNGVLDDGAAYTPWLYANATMSIGTASTLDGTAVRVVIRDGATTREVSRIAADRFPQFLGFVGGGDDVFWAEVSVTPDGPSTTRIMRGSWRSSARPVALTSDTGAAVFFESQYDLTVANGRVYWVAAAPTDDLVSEVRSVPVGGGKVSIRKVAGAYELSTWPWLQSAGGLNTPLNLLNLDTGQKVAIATAAAEHVACTPAWCRSVLAAPTGRATRIDVMRPDGSGRRRVAGAGAAAVSSDVGFLDRFDVVTLAHGADDAKQSLLLYDIDRRTLTTVAPDVGMVLVRAGVLWWSTGDAPTPSTPPTALSGPPAATIDPGVGQWHALDLRKLAGR
jgi:hypothetical protein